jgi:DNA-binding IclR family transcriptional regulator
MARQRCSVCVHPDLAAIEASISSGTPSLRDLAAQCGLSKAALFRHKQHAKVAKGSAAKNLSEEIRKLRIMLAKAKRKGDTTAALSISREIRAWMLMEAKTRPIVSQDSAVSDEMPLRDAVAIARSVIESQLDDPDTQAWLKSLMERVPVDLRATGTLPDTQE